MRVKSQRGFTLIEVLVVMGLVIIMLATSIFFTRPKSYANANADAERRLGIAAIAQGLQEYKVKHSGWPEGIPDKDVAIDALDGGYDLCKYLVPEFLQGIPLDPVLGTQYESDPVNPTLTDKTCTEDNIKYFSGYTIRHNSDNSLALTAGATTGKMEIIIR